MSKKYRIIGPDDPNFPKMRQRLLVTWLKTILGYLAMGGLALAAFAGFGFSYRFQMGFGLLWFLVPVLSWWFSAKIAIAMTKSTPADPSNPEHKRLLDIVDRVYAKSGLKFKPPVFISDNPLPNAFATGPIHRQAVVAATKGLFLTGMTDEEIEAVFAHELGHVKNYDVAINSMLSVISMIFFMIVDSGVKVLLSGIRIFNRDFGLKEELRSKPRGFITGVLEWVVMFLVFQITGQMTKVVQMFVMRARESAADATGSLMTGKPCDLASALIKLVAYVEKNRPRGREAELYRALRPIMTIDPIFDARQVDPAPSSLWQRLLRFWKQLQLTHPPVPERVAALETMNGGACTLPKV
ncbi:MAG TPA: M48 family metalloprotease [Candidatus Obscuribacter sp.]|nr:M48 family metalloprotease [Candidatus Melainabacteria bacterium]MBK8219733.1 M48 family metalloprotease [Candidatus Obscuribacter sp.]MBK9280265.1 M48 family metalloprotease [Candidatus Obscuribacter sp.]MDX1986615.1 M48 family metalloprotease [Candidatus Obscuribacter sp.]HMW92157.1 M48 family metalloprotease [Candidatus Obscuribacter sp.]